MPTLSTPNPSRDELAPEGGSDCCTTVLTCEIPGGARHLGPAKNTSAISGQRYDWYRQEERKLVSDELDDSKQERSA